MASVATLAMAQSTMKPAAPTGVTQRSFTQQLTPGFGPINVCPMGYLPSTTVIQSIHLIVCVVQPENLNRCAAQPNAYECGLNGNECCAARADNPCYPGAYACADPAAGTPNKHTACCMAR